MTGTAGYWHERSNDLKAITEEKGSWTCFKTWSAADTHWQDFFRIVTGKDELPSGSERYQLHLKHPLLSGDFFKLKWNNYFTKIKDLYQIDAFWFRYEFQARGSFHVHALLKLKNDPGLINLTRKAMEGHVAWIKLEQQEENMEELTAEQEEELQKKIDDGLVSKEIVERYHDWLIQAENPLGGTPIDDKNKTIWSRPNQHPCSKCFLNLNSDDYENDYIDCVNTFQRHKTCRAGYCLRTRKVVTKEHPEGELQEYCRFDSPWEVRDTTALTFEETELKNGDKKFVAKITPKRNDPLVNTHSRFDVQHWRANTDTQLILDATMCLKYITKYVSKNEKKSGQLIRALDKMAGYIDDNSTVKSTLTKLFMKILGERDWSKNEVLHLCTSDENYRSYYDVRKISLYDDVLFELRLTEDKSVQKSNDLHLYETRHGSKKKWSFDKFTQNYKCVYNQRQKIEESEKKKWYVGLSLSIHPTRQVKITGNIVNLVSCVINVLIN